jgi:hypothetical protein
MVLDGLVVLGFFLPPSFSFYGIQVCFDQAKKKRPLVLFLF